MERDIQARVMLLLGARPYIRIWRQNTGQAVYIGTDGRKRFVRYGVPGGGDISGILACGKRIELEIKDKNGRVREEQKLFGEMIDRMAGVYAVVRGEADAEKVVDSHLLSCTVCGNKTA